MNKPLYVSSAQVLREVQGHFRSSSLFAPLLSWQLHQASRDANISNQKKRAAGEKIKIGHGGTLDPLATGVLVVGVGKGTKQMNSFLGSPKTYETVVLFGKSTDTYDLGGKVVASAPHQHITKALVEEKLASFRGKIKQMPPIYSALKINGMKAYDYARTGKELPRELEARDVVVEQCEVVEWLEGGIHEYRWPATEAPSEIKQRAEETRDVVHDEVQEGERTLMRRLSDSPKEDREEHDEGRVKKQSTALEGTTTESTSDLPSTQEGLEDGKLSLKTTHLSSELISNGLTAAEEARLHTHEVGPLSSEICAAPAARIRVTVSSGFYVRSLAHDLGIACGSLALMASLFRSRQGEFDAGSTLTYQDLAGGEDVWRPKVEHMLRSWNEKHPRTPRFDDRDRSESPKNKPGGKRKGHGQRSDTDETKRAKRDQNRERRNTSSGEE